MKKLPTQNHFHFKPKEVVISDINSQKEQSMKYDSVISSILNQASPSTLSLMQSKSHKEQIIQFKSKQKPITKSKTEIKPEDYMSHSNSIKSNLHSRFLSLKDSKKAISYYTKPTISPTPSCLSNKSKRFIPSTKIQRINLEESKYHNKKIKVISFVRFNTNNHKKANLNKSIDHKQSNTLNKTKSLTGMKHISPNHKKKDHSKLKDKAGFQGTININVNVFVQSPKKNKSKDNKNSSNSRKVKCYKIRNHSNLSKEREKRNFENRLTFAEKEKSLEEMGQRINSIYLTQESINSVYDVSITDSLKSRAKIINIFRMKRKNEDERINTVV